MSGVVASKERPKGRFRVGTGAVVQTRADEFSVQRVNEVDPNRVLGPEANLGSRRDLEFQYAAGRLGPYVA